MFLQELEFLILQFVLGLEIVFFFFLVSRSRFMNG